MLPCHSCYIYGTWRNNELGGFKIILWRETEGGKPQSQRGAFLWGHISELPTYFSLFWSKKSSVICTT